MYQFTTCYGNDAIHTPCSTKRKLRQAMYKHYISKGLIKAAKRINILANSKAPSGAFGITLH